MQTPRSILTRYDGEVSEPLVGRQGSRVSMRVARGSASLLLNVNELVGKKTLLGPSKEAGGHAAGHPRLGSSFSLEP